jgi:hypothetical protein
MERIAEMKRALRSDAPVYEQLNAMQALLSPLNNQPSGH